MGTHPIFESDFDCLTELIGMKSLLCLMVFRRILTSELPYPDKEYISFECDTRVTTIEKNMTIHWGGGSKCIYGTIDEIEENTDPFREYDKDKDKMYCRALGGSCFHVQYYTRNGTNCRKTACAKTAFYFAGCAVNNTRRALEYEKMRRVAGGEFNMNHLNQDEFPPMCFGVHKKSTGENSNYEMMERHGFKEIHHVDLSMTMFSRVYCCNNTYCNKEGAIFYDRSRDGWMDLLEVQIDDYLNKTAKMKAKSERLSISIILLLLSLFLCKN